MLGKVCTEILGHEKSIENLIRKLQRKMSLGVYVKKVLK
jgi:hypothetical protein